MDEYRHPVQGEIARFVREGGFGITVVILEEERPNTPGKARTIAVESERDSHRIGTEGECGTCLDPKGEWLFSNIIADREHAPEYLRRMGEAIHGIPHPPMEMNLSRRG